MYLPIIPSLGCYPVDSIQKLVNWVHFVAHDYSTPNGSNFTGAHAALYDPTNFLKTDYAIGPAIRNGGSMKYKEIQNYIKIYGDGTKVLYSATYVVNYCRIGSVWIGFDDVEVVRTKVSYIKEKKLRGYFVWQVTFDGNWVLSQAAAEEVKMKVSVHNNKNGQKRQITKLRLKTGDSDKKLKCKVNNTAAAEDLTTVVPNVIVYSLTSIEATTDSFSIENKIGEGGYGPVYKAYLLWKNGKGMEFMDPSLDCTYSLGKLMRCFPISLLCVQECANDRPTMLEIFSYLQNESTYIKIPKEPAYATQINEEEQQRSTLKVEICSVNDTTISDMVPR
ncbi:hypothetical protein QYF36_004505 [Acer negundo]|nr:hypothetical protein QYF36_004505 [Acer negundo]